MFAALQLIVMTVLLFSGCKPDRRPELFELNHTIDFTIQPGLNTIETHFFVTSGIQSQLALKLSDFSLDTSAVASIEPKYAELSTVFRDRDLDFIREISIRVFDQFSNINREAFYLDPVPANTRTAIRPFPGLTDIAPIMEQNRFGVEVLLRFWRITPQEMNMRLEFDLSVKGK